MSFNINSDQEMGISLGILRQWIAWQLGNWEVWAAAQPDDGWLRIETGNPGFPTVGLLMRHAFAPVRRYAERSMGQEPFDDSVIGTDQFADLAGFSRECLAIHDQAAAGLDLQQARVEVSHQTRGAGEWTLTGEEALVHSLMHCFWHLGGMVQLLRSRGIEPPQRNDLVFFCAQQRRK